MPDTAGRALFVGDAGLYAKASLAELSRGASRYILAPLRSSAAAATCR
jgi:hypothetical protein